MTALAKDRPVSKKGSGQLQGHPVAASTKIYGGALVGLNSGGYAVAAADASAVKLAGVATAQVDNTSGGNGDLTVVVESGMAVLYNATSITLAMVGRPMFVVDDNTFDDTPGTNSIFAGVLMEYVSSTSGYLWIPRGMPGNDNLAGVKGGRVTFGQHTTVAASDTVVTGLAVVIAAGASLDSDPGDDPEAVSVSVGDQAGTPAAGSILIKTWKNSGTDPTPTAASTFSKKVNYWAFGY